VFTGLASYKTEGDRRNAAAAAESASATHVIMVLPA
jgi:hypothetical protein